MKKVLTALALGFAALTASAQAWPTAKPVTLLVPFPPGGSTDMIARSLSTKLQEKLGGTFVVQNTASSMSLCDWPQASAWATGILIRQTSHTQSQPMLSFR